MPVHLYLAPAAAGKTAYLIERARAWAADPAKAPRVVVPTQLQVRVWRRRLAEAGGALGVHVGTFEALYRDVLRATGQVYTRLTDPIQYRLLRTLVAEAELVHYAPLRASPGFVQEVLRLIRELKAGGVFPEELTAAVEGMGREPRLLELADLYLAYQERLQEGGWADAAGSGWLAAEALEGQPDACRGWPCLLVDGFDDLTTVQIRVLSALAGRVEALMITLTGTTGDRARQPVHARFQRTRDRLEEALGVGGEPLPAPAVANHRAPALAHLEAALWTDESAQPPADGAVALVAATDREGEVRAALRWLKRCLIAEGMRPGEVALLARALEPYRLHIAQVAEEYGLPVHIVGGLPLRGNPAVAALLDLMGLASPGNVAFSWRPTVEAWRSPYLDWSPHLTPSAAEPIAITPQDADALDRVARWGSVVGGLGQWTEAFDLLAAALIQAGPREALDEEALPPPEVLPTGEEVGTLREKFDRFVQRVTPPEGTHSCRAFVRWIEQLIGDAPTSEGTSMRDAPSADLGVVRCILAGPAHLVERDVAALNALKDVLRGLVWAEDALACAPLTFDRFYEDLVGAVDAASYNIPLPADREAVTVADVGQARGVPYRAVALLGLAEGEFPTALAEDPFLRDADRWRLRKEYGLEVDLSTVGAEPAYFYEAVTRPRQALLLTRPRIADNGAPWQASPFWEEVRRRVAVEPRRLTGGSYPAPEEAASWPELLLGVGARPEDAALWAWAMGQDGARCAALEAAVGVLRGRVRPPGEPSTLEASTAYDGDLARWGATFSRRYGPDHVWSASRLESYRACPLFFFVGSALGLEPRQPPAEGLDARQLGNLYHRILEEVYRAVGDPTDLGQLLDALPEVAGPILDQAPRREGFRATAWWGQTRDEIVEQVRRSLSALETLRGDYVPQAYEQAFGIPGRAGEALVVRDPEGEDVFLLHGLIDRVDRAPDGRVRIVDYKTGGPSSYNARALQEGKKLQLPLYALAAQEALGLGTIADGYYWHVRHAGWHLEHARSASWFTLARAGVDEALGVALACSWEAVRAVRDGRFAPHPPDDGCPDYCPTAAFCWHYTPRSW